MGIWPWDEPGPSKTPLSRGVVIGKAPGPKGLAVALVGIQTEYKTAQIYDGKGKKQNGIWTQTVKDGLFLIKFQWDNAMDIDKFINTAPTWCRLLVYSDKSTYNRYWVQIGLIVNMYGMIKGQKIMVDPPGGWFASFMADKGRDWLFSRYPNALAILKQNVPLKSTEMYTALSVADLTDETMYSPG